MFVNYFPTNKFVGYYHIVPMGQEAQFMALNDMK
jgi:hypothetical protein